MNSACQFLRIVSHQVNQLLLFEHGRSEDNSTGIVETGGVLVVVACDALIRIGCVFVVVCASADGSGVLL